MEISNYVFLAFEADRDRGIGVLILTNGRPGYIDQWASRTIGSEKDGGDQGM